MAQNELGSFLRPVRDAEVAVWWMCTNCPKAIFIEDISVRNKSCLDASVEGKYREKP